MLCSSEMMRCSVICLQEQNHQSRFFMIQISISVIVLVTIVHSERNMPQTELSGLSRRLIKHPLSLRHVWPLCSCKLERGTSDAARLDPCLRWVDSKSESDGAVVALINAVPVALGA